jgi:hypothetical protein
MKIIYPQGNLSYMELILDWIAEGGIQLILILWTMVIHRNKPDFFPKKRKTYLDLSVDM